LDDCIQALSLIRWFVRSSDHSSIHSFARSFVRSFIHSFVHPLILIHPFTLSYIHSHDDGKWHVRTRACTVRSTTAAAATTMTTTTTTTKVVGGDGDDDDKGW
jgi:hypothetical protein